MKIRVFTFLLILTLLATGISVSAANYAAPVSHRVTAPTDAGIISPERAQNIALEHAGFTADQVARLRTEYEVDDGVRLYEVKFRQGRWEYDYEINANTGAILSYDRDD